MSKRYAVQAAYFSEAIHAGTISHDGKAFEDKQDVTGNVFHAVAAFAEKHHGGSMRVDLKDGRTLEIDVKEDTNE